MKKCNGDKCASPNNKECCECDFLRPLCIDSLFTINHDNEICDVLNKTKKVRNSLITVKVALKNNVDT